MRVSATVRVGSSIPLGAKRTIETEGPPRHAEHSPSTKECSQLRAVRRRDLHPQTTAPPQRHRPVEGPPTCVLHSFPQSWQLIWHFLVGQCMERYDHAETGSDGKDHPNFAGWTPTNHPNGAHSPQIKPIWIFASRSPSATRDGRPKKWQMVAGKYSQIETRAGCYEAAHRTLWVVRMGARNPIRRGFASMRQRSTWDASRLMVTGGWVCVRSSRSAPRGSAARFNPGCTQGAAGSSTTTQRPSPTSCRRPSTTKPPLQRTSTIRAPRNRASPCSAPFASNSRSACRFPKALRLT